MTEAEKAEVFDALRECCGAVENASDRAVTVFQDDATKAWFAKTKTVCSDARYTLGDAIFNLQLKLGL